MSFKLSLILTLFLLEFLIFFGGGGGVKSTAGFALYP